MKRRWLFLCLILVLMIPFPTEVCPEWRVRIVNEKGEPRSGKQIDQACRNYTLGIDPCDTNDSRQFSDQNGFVVFPRREIWSGLLPRIARSMFHILYWPATHSLGTKVYLFAAAPNYPILYYTPGEPLPKEMTLEDYH